ncbi:MAG: PP2C family protein-serine/threonine phosphatase [Gammaproteobacteria bacterium]
MGIGVNVEFAELSHVGHREENQDRAAVAALPCAVLLLVVDGMGGHADGALAAATARAALLDAFHGEQVPLLDPLGFLHRALGRAHEAVCELGRGLKLEERPRATCAVAVVQQGCAFWAHIGDSRVYHLREGAVLERTRDHSHVEALLQDGAITEAEMARHPMRNFVEQCIGGDPVLPEMSLSGQQRLAPGDVILACTDGTWASLKDAEIAAFFGTLPPGKAALEDGLRRLVERSVHASAPYSDNSTATAVRWLA